MCVRATVPERRKRELTRRCAWCGKIDRGPGWLAERRKEPPPATHGICPACFDGQMAPNVVAIA